MTALGSAKAAELLRELFDTIDTNKDGALEWSELEGNVGRADPAKARQLMDCAFGTKDRMIDFESFSEFMEDNLKAEGLSMDTATAEHFDSVRTHFVPFTG